MLLRRSSLLARPLARAAARRCFSSSLDASTPHVVVQSQGDGVASVQLSSAPVNAISGGLCEDLITVLNSLEEVRARRSLRLNFAAHHLASGAR